MKQSDPKRLSHFLRPRSLRYQLLQRSLLMMAALLFMIGILQYVLMKDFLYNNKADTLEAQLMSLPPNWFNGQGIDDTTVPNGAASNSGLSRSNRVPPQSPLLYQPGLSLAYLDLDGNFTDMTMNSEVLSPRLSQQTYEQIEKELRGHKRTNFIIAHDSGGVEQLLVFRQIGPPGGSYGIVQVGTETSALQTVLLTQLAIFIGLSVLALAGGLSLYLPLLRRTLKPLSSTVQAVEQTDAGNLTDLLQINQGQLEIDRLSVAFNHMLERLDTSFEAERRTTEKMRRFIADASHELRTPLTSIQGFIEVLLRGAASNPEQLHRALTSMQLESKRINKLVEHLLLLAKLDQAPSVPLTATRLDRLLHEMDAQLRILGGSRTIHIDIASNVTVRCHPDQMKQVILNLFLNAVQHTNPSTGAITVSLSAEDSDAKLSVSDNGIGIMEEHIPHLFERFYRSEASRTRKSGGSGLGLAITKSIVDAHEGQIEIFSQLGVGSTFLVRLPLEPEAKARETQTVISR